MNAPILPIRVANGDDIRRFNLDTNQPNPFGVLLSQICNLYSLNMHDFQPGSASFKLVYKDDMNSDISISTTEELGYAMQYSVQKDPLALYVIPIVNQQIDHFGDYKAEKWNFKREKHERRRRENRDKKYSNGKVYGSLDIYDPDEIELYKRVLIELDESGHRKFKSNLKFLKQFRQGNDFSEAINKIKENDERKSRERKLKKEKKMG